MSHSGGLKNGKHSHVQECERFTCRPRKHHDPVMLFPASAHSKKCRKKKKTVSVAVSYSEIAIAVLPRRRLGRLQKLAFLQERDDRFSTSGAE